MLDVKDTSLADEFLSVDVVIALASPNTSGEMSLWVGASRGGVVLLNRA